jgi:hypothetical protein
LSRRFQFTECLRLVPSAEVITTHRCGSPGSPPWSLPVLSVPEVSGAYPAAGKLQACPGVDRSSAVQLGQHERTLREGIDRACKKFAHDQKWPKLNPEELLLLSHRLALALIFLRFLEIEHQSVRIVSDPTPEIPNWRVLEFLLIDYWQSIGCEQYLLQATRLLQGLTLTNADNHLSGSCVLIRAG